MNDYIYDPETGRCVARVRDREVFRGDTGAKVATVGECGNLYDLHGRHIGHLSPVDLPAAGASKAFKTLLA